MRLYLDGITRNTDNPRIIADLKKAGYVEVEEPEEIQAAETTNEGGDSSSEVKQEKSTPEVPAPKKKAGK